VAERIDMPPGYTIKWSGQFEQMEAANRRLTVIVPLAFVLIVLLLYLATFSWLRVALVLLIVPLSMVGSFWLLWALDYDMSVAVVVGLIAMAGLEVETGLIMLLYLDESYHRFEQRGVMRNLSDLWDAVHDGAVRRIRPKAMTELTTFAGLLPLLWAEGAGADTMRRLAAPMIGGVALGFFAETIILPTLYFVARAMAMRWRQWREKPALTGHSDLA
jgi:Cu(I)/Ag(I) efflux system membrane protein CusA/SilA